MALLLLPLLAALIPCEAFADVIYLKNGRKITAQVTKEDAEKVTYAVEGGELSISKSLVDHIEKAAAPAEENAPGEDRTPPAGASEIPLPAPPYGELSDKTGLPVIKDGAVDEAYLLYLDNELTHHPSPESTRLFRQGYQQAALFLANHGNPEGAIQKCQEALKYLPNDLSLTLTLGHLQVKQNHFLEAMDLLLPAADRYPKSAGVRILLGAAFYGMENMDEAIAQWNKSLALEDNPRVRKAIAKAEHEREVAGSYSELRSEHFLLHYDGEHSEKLSGAVLGTLEASFQELALDLDYNPSEVIVVLLYPNTAFRDITRSPTWVGAVNDGKIRVPVSGLTQMNAALASVLKHELTHSFVRQITGGHCPTWFNEGLAQLEEGSTTATWGSRLAREFNQGSLPSFQSLEGPFLNLPQEQAALAYAKSLAALEYLRATFDMSEIRNLLKATVSQSDFGIVLRDNLHLTYPAFEQEVAGYIMKKYGM